jgi:hypothetical protein
MSPLRAMVVWVMKYVAKTAPEAEKSSSMSNAIIILRFIRGVPL